MILYQPPTDLSVEINKLEEETLKFKKGESRPEKFTAERVSFGVYEQRDKGSFMTRVRCSAGAVTPVQLKKAAETAQKFGKPLLHITTRQEIQLHDVKLEDTPEIMRELLSVGLSSRGGGGNTVRNIMGSYDSGINPEEIFDVYPYVVECTNRLIRENDSWNLPRKLKVSFSSASEDNALAMFNDLGFIARIADGKKGFQVWIAGGMGCRPRIAHLLHDFIPAEKAYYVCAAVKKMFFEYGNRKNKNSNRLRFLWDELGGKKFLSLYRQEAAKIENDPRFELKITKIKNKAQIKGIAPKNVTGEHFDIWKSRHVKKQKQPGLKSVMIPIGLGDLKTIDAIKLAKKLDFFGTNVIRFTMRQNIHLRNIPTEYLGNIYETVLEMDTLSHLPEISGNIVTCATGVCLPRNLAPAVEKLLTTTSVGEDLPAGLKINISGCPNACGQHHAADLGFFGRISRKNGRVYPAYRVMGGADTNPENPRFSQKTAIAPARDLPEIILEIMENFKSMRNNFSNFNEYFHSGGKEAIKDICRKYTDNVPDFEKNENYYYDWGSLSPFSIAHMEHGECSAGIYDMIEVEMESIKSNIKLAKFSTDTQKTRKALWNIVFSSASMLLVTRGVDPKNEEETFQKYIRHFIDAGIVPEEYREIIRSAQVKNYESLEKNKEKALSLGDLMTKLYHSMDNSLKFPGERENDSSPPRPASEREDEAKCDASRFKDLRKVKCPMNFVKTKVELAYISNGDKLEIYLDDGEPIENVPRSVLGEGHKIISQDKIDDYWSVVIEKA